MSQTEDDGFERFIDRHTTSREVPTISIRTNRTLGLNNAAKKSFGDPSHVVLLFNHKTRTIALEPASLEEKGAYRIVQNNRRSASFSVAAAAFTSAYGIPHDRA